MDNSGNEKLQALFLTYAEKLPEKLRNIRANWEILKNDFKQNKFQDFHREVHSLTGSAGTYGYMELSKSARALEIYLKSLLLQTGLGAEDQFTIENLLKQLETTQLVSDSPFFSVLNHKETSRCILILDNDKDFIKGLCDELAANNYEIKTVATFSELIKSAENKTPIALIVDVIYLGVEEVNQLGVWQKKLDIPVPLFCTAASGCIMDRLRAVRAGGIAFVRKPVDTFYLIKMLDQTIGLTPIDPFRILIIEDSLSLSEYYKAVLQEAGMIAESLTKPLLTLDRIAEFQPDLLLLDLYMPECSGVELAAVLRQEPKYTRLPIIFLSSEEDKYTQLAALNLGGDDFLTKPILPQHLVATVKSRAKRAGILSSFMMRDSLTGLLNHSNILYQLEVELARAQNYHHPLSFAMIDIDHFKIINDKYGHMVGDKVLKKLSEILILRLRKSDYIGRYGGEEFAVILPNTKIAAAKKILDELRKKFSQLHFVSETYDFTVSFSVGVAGYEKDPVHAQGVIEAADQALYHAKHSGRNQVVLA